jgi:hypothetical protein
LNGFHLFAPTIDADKLSIGIGLSEREEWPTATSAYISYDHVRFNNIKLDNFKCINNMFVVDSLFIADCREIEFGISVQKSGNEEFSIIHVGVIMIV